MSTYHSTPASEASDLWERIVLSEPHSTEEAEALNEAKQILQPMIYNSWLNSKRNNVDPFSPKKRKLSPDEIKRRLKKNRFFIDVSLPHLESLLDFLDRENFAAIVADDEAYTLAMIGGEGQNMKSLLLNDGVDIGVDRKEEYAGTCGLSLVAKEKKPLQIIGSEHYVKYHHPWTSSATPVHDTEGNIIGCINIFGPTDLVHPHTLGMTIAAAKGIEKEMKLIQVNKELTMRNRQLNYTLQFTNAGVIMVDENLIIQQYNQQAASLLDLDPSQLDMANIMELIPMKKSGIDLSSLTEPIKNKELRFKSSSGSTITLNASITAITGNRNIKEGFVLVLQEMKQLHHIANSISGFTAKYTFDSIIGNSAALHACKRIGEIAAQSTSNLLILGESGTGKELFAQAIHNASDRADKPFIPINCASLPKQLIESELFGYESGTFTGADKNGRPGKFELAEEGTIFLDEIGDMPLDVQTSLLRVLQSREVVRIGGKTSRPIDVRIIAATNHDLFDDVKNQAFRGDLYYRFNVLLLTVPPLRERLEDLILLSNHFMQKYVQDLQKDISSISPAAVNLLLRHKWPGNVRELENVIERAVNISSSHSISVEDLPADLIRDTEIMNPSHVSPASENPATGTLTEGTQHAVTNTIPTPAAQPAHNTTESPTLTIKDSEKQAIEIALQKTAGNVKRAADALGIGRKTLYNKIKQYDIDVQIYRTI